MVPNNNKNNNNNNNNNNVGGVWRPVSGSKKQTLTRSYGMMLVTTPTVRLFV